MAGHGEENMIDHSLDDHMAEHLAEKASKEAAAQAAKEAEQAIVDLRFHADRENEHFDRIRREAGTLAAIVRQMRAQTNLRIEHLEAEGKILCGGVNVTYDLEIKAEWTKDSWRSKPTGRTRITVGDYGSRTSYPQRKDGTHNYADIAHALVGYAERKIAEKQRLAIVSGNSGASAELCVEFGLDGYGRVRITPSSSADAPVFVTVEIKQAMTIDQARRLALALRSVGLIKEKKA